MLFGIQLSKTRPAVLVIMMLAFQPGAFAAGPPELSSIDNPLAITMIIIMVILLLAIALLANVVLGAAEYFHEKEKQLNNRTGAKPTAAITVSVIGLLFLAMPAVAQEQSSDTATTVAATIGGLSKTAFYFMIAVITVELLVIFILLYLLKSVLPKKERVVKVLITAEQKTANRLHWWNKINSFKPIEQEADIELNHDYDGIRELDNRLPPWWIYGFYVTIIFAAVYLWRYHVSHTAPSSEQEYQLAMKKAEEQKARYLKNAANNVDESTVKLLTQAPDLDAGKKVFEQNCTPCHGKAAEGNTVGPNLTDDYWLHGGSLGDVFKSVKYGWPDKGMRSWKDDFSPLQIAQITSYVKSLHGSNPPNAKEPQGDLYKEAAGADSTSTQVAAQ